MSSPIASAPPAGLTVALLGPISVAHDGQTITDFGYDKVCALLAYLVVESDHPQRRTALAEMLWPDRPEGVARHSLRPALARLRTTLGDRDALPPYLLITPETIQFNAASHHWCDVAQFNVLLTTCQAHEHTRLETCLPCLDRLRQATALYHGPFLERFYLDDSTLFEEWALVKREQIQRQAMEALGVLATYHEGQGEYEAAARYARRQVELVPTHEEAHQQLIRVLGAAGQRAQALAQYETLRRVLADELGLQPSVPTTALAERIRSGEQATATLSSPPPSHNLPTQLTPFVGREREQAEISAMLQASETRLLTLVGEGGMGKTRLALEAARARLPAFADGVFFVSLAPLASSDAIADAIASALGLTLHGDPQPALLRSLRDKQALLILDNFEHLLDGVALAVELLQAADGVQIIATSRERLHVRGEHVYHVQAMDVEMGATLTTAATSSAVRLFAQCARRARPDFKLSDSNLPTVLHICRLVGGMPLGLELAAAWVESVSLDEIAGEIENSADFLALEWRDAPPRQRSLRAVFDWSWRLLNDTERQVYGRLSVFRGGFTRDAAQAVVGAALRVLTSLGHKSLLRWAETHERGGRYEMHELLRQFAAERLAASAEDKAAVEGRHSEFYLAFVAARETRIAGNEPRQAATEIRGELDNIRQAWAWASHHVRLRELDQSMFALVQSYWFMGLAAENEQMLRLAIGSVQARREQAISADALQAVSLEQVLSKLLALQALALVNLSAYDQAIRAAQQAIARGQASGGVEGEAYAALAWGEALIHKGDIVAGRGQLREALQLTHRYLPDHPTSATLLHIEWSAYLYLGFSSFSQGDYAEARAFMVESLRLCRSQGRLRGEMTVLVNLPDIARELRDYTSARQDYEQALHLARRLSFAWGEGVALRELGDVWRLQGDYGRAQDLITQSLPIVRAIGIHYEEAMSLVCLGRLYSYLGNYARARDWLDQFQQATQGIASPLVNYTGQLALTIHHLHTGETDAALQNAAQALEQASSLGNLMRKADALVLLGHAQAAIYPTEAASAYHRALTLYRSVGQRPVAAEAQAGLASLALAQSDLAQALIHVEQILTVLADHPRAGLDEPFLVYLTCYRVLLANHDPRSLTILETARGLLRDYADHIPDPGLRQSFLENVAVHRELHQAYCVHLF